MSKNSRSDLRDQHTQAEKDVITTTIWTKTQEEPKKKQEPNKRDNTNNINHNSQNHQQMKK